MEPSCAARAISGSQMHHRTAALLLVTALYCHASIAICAAGPNGEPLTTPAATGAGCSLVFQTTTSQNATTLCPDTRVITADFPYMTSSSVTNVSFTAVAVNIAAGPGADPTVACAVSSSGMASNPSARVNCTRNDGGPYPPTFLYRVLLTASFNCGSSLSSEAYASANFSITGSPKITIQQQRPANLSVCSDATTVSVDYSFNVTGEISAGKIILGSQQLQQQRLTAAASSVAGTSCSAKVFPGPPTTMGNMFITSGTATVTCQGTLLKPPSALDLSFALSARIQGCTPTTATANTRVLVVCCKQGRSYVRQRRVGQRQAKCFSHYPPGTSSSDCGTSSAVFGFYNQGPATARLALFDSNTTKCASRATVGTAAMSCDSSNNKLVKFQLQSSNKDLGADQQFLLSCSPPSTSAGTCPGSLQWQDVLLKGLDRTIRLTDRFKVTTFSAVLPDAAGCDCSDAVWAVYESGVYTGLPAELCS